MALTIARTSSGNPSSGAQFQEQIEQLRTIDKLWQEADDLEDEGDFYDSVARWSALAEDTSEDDPQIEAMREESRKAREKAEELANIHVWIQ